MIYLDIEIYRNYFLASFYKPSTNKFVEIEAYPGKEIEQFKLARIMRNNTTVSFNGISFDLPIIAAAINGASIETLKALADKIILSGEPSWKICKQAGLRVPNWDHIDLIEVAPGQASLKIYGGRINAPTMQDLPIEPDALIEPEQRAPMRQYCRNDLETTFLLHQKLKKQVVLRESMSKEYGVDLRSKSDAQIAEAVLKSEIQKKTGRKLQKPSFNANKTFRYRKPSILSFRTPVLSQLYKDVLETDFTLAANGSIKMPATLAKAKIEIGRSTYNLGVGGLHSMEKSQYIEVDDDFMLLDVDVASYYPNIILEQSLAPESMGKSFLDVYQSIVNRRLNAKKSGDKVTADTLKICVNGSFGKLGSRYSFLYSPDLLLQTTLTGQLALLMLIESLEQLPGVSIVSANTDGIVIHLKRSRLDDVRNTCADWEIQTSYELEETHYRLIASRDVNNYLAVTTDGQIKRKGVFAAGGLMKNPDRNISYTAVAELLANNTPIENTIKNCKDVTQFVTVRKVTGGAVWQGQELGKAVRFYYSNEVDAQMTINYKKNSNKVPNSDGTRPLMTLGDFPKDIDYQVYIDYANKLLEHIGYA